MELTNNAGKWHNEVADAVDAILSDQPSPIVPDPIQQQLVGEYAADGGNRVTLVSDGPFLQLTYHWAAGPKSYGMLVGSKLEGMHWRERGDGTLHEVRCKKAERVESLTTLGVVFRRA